MGDLPNLNFLGSFYYVSALLKCLCNPCGMLNTAESVNVQIVQNLEKKDSMPMVVVTTSPGGLKMYPLYTSSIHVSALDSDNHTPHQAQFYTNNQISQTRSPDSTQVSFIVHTYPSSRSSPNSSLGQIQG